MFSEYAGRAAQQTAAADDERGFTLIEVLVATTILTLMIYLALTAYSFFGESWRKGRLSDTRSLDLYRNHILCRDAVESICDYYVTDPTSELNGIHYPYFIGTDHSAAFVTLSSVFEQGIPASARIRLVETPSGARNLVYEETPLLHQYIRYEDSVPEYAHQIVLFENVKAFHIRYYGVWTYHFNDATMDFEAEYRWLTEYYGKDRKAVPEIIEMTVSTDTGDTVMTLPVKAFNPFKAPFFEREF